MRENFKAGQKLNNFNMTRDVTKIENFRFEETSSLNIKVGDKLQRLGKLFEKYAFYPQGNSFSINK